MRGSGTDEWLELFENPKYFAMFAKLTSLRTAEINLEKAEQLAELKRSTVSPNSVTVDKARLALLELSKS
jgi:hypothetical protein